MVFVGISVLVAVMVIVAVSVGCGGISVNVTVGRRVSVWVAGSAIVDVGASGRFCTQPTADRPRQ